MSTLIVYEPIENFGEKTDYWRVYVDFYENYWGGPTSPFGVWFGNEYDAFRKALASNFGVEEVEIDDCFFMKDEDGRYFVAPLGSKENAYLISSENYIPLHWFLLFKENDRKTLYTHWGFNAIHYDTKIDLGLNRIKEAEKVIAVNLAKKEDIELELPIFSSLTELQKGIVNLEMGLSGFDPSGFVVLNYGEICSFIHPYTIKNENSVGELWGILTLLSQGKTNEADSSLKVIIKKWEEIRRKASGEIDKITVQ